MKLIFIVLLAGNLGFFLMQILSEKSAPEVKANLVSIKEFGGLQTLHERNANDKRAAKGVKRTETSAKSASSAPSDSEQCELIGPFAELLHAEYLVERLASLDVAALVRDVEIVDGKNYWVYLRPEMSEKEALRRLSEIQQVKAIDSYIIPSGELANGISFGQFASLDDANVKAELIRTQGYAAEIKEFPKSHNEVWVEVREKNEQKINQEKWLELLKEEKAIERRQNYCLGVAH